jgi:hypothetical protein
MKSKMKLNKINKKIEENYIENHPFSPMILDESKLNITNHSKKLFEESGFKIKIPVHEKLYK